MRKVQSFSFDSVFGDIYHISDTLFELRATCVFSGRDTLDVHVWAASPSGAAQAHLPFPNAAIAHDSTTTRHAIRVHASRPDFRVQFRYPNAYYTQQGRVYVPPHINVCVLPGETHKIFLPYDAPAVSLSTSLFGRDAYAQDSSSVPTA